MSEEKVVVEEKTVPISAENSMIKFSIITGFVVCLSLITYLVICISTLSKEVEASKIELAEVSSKVSKATTTNNQVEAIRRVVTTLLLSHETEDAIVTDDFILDKLYVTSYEPLRITLDVENQPDMSYIYKDKGAYDISDRELRAKIENLINTVKESYIFYSTDGHLPVWDENTETSVTVFNYNIATVKNEEVVLAGEK